MNFVPTQYKEKYDLHYKYTIILIPIIIIDRLQEVTENIFFLQMENIICIIVARF